jgi:hypothetical protein
VIDRDVRCHLFKRVERKWNRLGFAKESDYLGFD